MSDPRTQQALAAAEFKVQRLRELHNEIHQFASTVEGMLKNHPYPTSDARWAVIENWAKMIAAALAPPPATDWREHYAHRPRCGKCGAEAVWLGHKWRCDACQRELPSRETETVPPATPPEEGR